MERKENRREERKRGHMKRSYVIITVLALFFFSLLCHGTTSSANCFFSGGKTKKEIEEEKLVEDIKKLTGEGIEYGWGCKAVSGKKVPEKLDCSGFVQWCFWHVIKNKKIDDLYSTYSITHSGNLKKLGRDNELKVGDVGTLYKDGSCWKWNGKKWYDREKAEQVRKKKIKKMKRILKRVKLQKKGLNIDETNTKRSKRMKKLEKTWKKVKKKIKSKVNHCGIYIGNNRWIHCSSSNGGIVIAKGYPFKHFYRVVK